MNVAARNQDDPKTLLSAPVELLQDVIASIPAGMIILDGKGCVIRCNAQAQSLLEQPLIGEQWVDIVSRVFQPRADDGFEVSLRDGRRLSLSTAPLTQQAGQMVFLNDLTPSRTLQEKQHQRQRLHALGNMAVSLAHQIRTPLAAAILYASHLSNSSVIGDNRQRFSQKLQESLSELERQINDVLLYARGSECQAVSEVSWSQVFATVHKELEVVEQKQNIQIIYPNLSHDWALMTNPHVLKSVLINLVMNAIQAEAREVVFCLERDENNYILEAKDNGHGIDSQTLSHVFDPFFTTKERGTGLGLAIVKTIMQAHGGSIDVKTQVEQGTSFYLYFPRNAQARILTQGATL